MITKIQIDHREWKEWMDTSKDGAIGKLNFLLEPHGVKLEVISYPSDWIVIQATSQNWYEQNAQTRPINKDV